MPDFPREPEDHHILPGIPLASLSGMRGEMARRAGASGFTHAGALISAAAVPAIRPFLLAKLGLDTEEDLTHYITQIKSQLPGGLGDLYDQQVIKPPGLGAVPPSHEAASRAASLAVPRGFAAAPMKTEVNLQSGMPPVRDQGQGNTCVAFATTALHEYALLAQGTSQDQSERQLYAETKAIDGTNQPCDGTFVAAAAQILANRGQVPETSCPYMANQAPCYYGPAPTGSTTLPIAGPRRLLTLEPLPRNSADPNSHGLPLEAIKRALSAGSPVAVDFPVYQDVFTTANITKGLFPDPIGLPQLGGHCVCLVGYKDDPTAPGGGYFIVRNSWGVIGTTGGPVYWGEASGYGKGYGTISYDYISTSGMEAAALSEPVVAPPAPDRASPEVQPPPADPKPAPAPPEPGKPTQEPEEVKIRGGVRVVIETKNGTKIYIS